MSSYIKKNGLLYSEDLHTVLGVDDTSTEFNGRVPFGAHKIDDDVFSDCPYESISLPDSVTELEIVFLKIQRLWKRLSFHLD